jgi:hypothetical protein
MRERLLGLGTVLRGVVGADELAHQRCDRVGIDGLTPARGEHVVIGALPVLAKRQLLGRLTRTMPTENARGFLIETDHAGPSALGGSFDALSFDHGRASLDPDLRRLKIDL